MHYTVKKYIMMDSFFTLFLRACTSTLMALATQEQWESLAVKKSFGMIGGKKIWWVGSFLQYVGKEILI